jgi:hypothetical protein
MADYIQHASPMTDRGHTIALPATAPQALGGFVTNPTHVWVRRALADAIDTTLERGFTTFIAGMALGVDT